MREAKVLFGLMLLVAIVFALGFYAGRLPV
jgi:hypothetical protein